MIDVMLSTNRCVATSVSLAVMSRPTDIQVGTIGREGGVEDPVVVRPHVDDLLAGLGIDGPDRIVEAAEGDLAAVGGPARAHRRCSKVTGTDIASFWVSTFELHLAHPAGPAAGDDEPLAVGRERTDSIRSERPIRRPTSPRNRRPSRQDSVEPAHGQELARWAR